MHDDIYGDFTANSGTQTLTDVRSFEPGIGRVVDELGVPVTQYYHGDMIGTTRVMTARGSCDPARGLAIPLSGRDRGWLGSVRRGSVIVFWSLLIPPLLTNLSGFLLPFLGGNIYELSWIGVIHTLGSIPLLVGVFRLTGCMPQSYATRRAIRYARAFRGLAILDVVARFSARIRFLILATPLSAYFAFPLLLEDVAFALVGAGYMAYLCSVLGFDKLRRRVWVAIWVYVACGVLGWCMEPSGASWVEDPLALVLLVLWSVLWIAIAVWCLIVLRRFIRLVGHVLEGRCVQCGYVLLHLGEARCPECGRPFVRAAEVEVTAGHE